MWRCYGFYVHFLKVLYFFFLVGYVILKDFTIPVCCEIHWWRHDNWPIGQWVIFRLETSSLARSLGDHMHWISLRSLLRTCERSTCSRSRFYADRLIGSATEWSTVQCGFDHWASCFCCCWLIHFYWERKISLKNWSQSETAKYFKWIIICSKIGMLSLAMAYFSDILVKSIYK